VEIEREGDRIEGRLVLGLQHRDCQPSSTPTPAEREEGTALSLDRDGLLYKIGVYVFIELGHQSSRRALDQQRVASGPPVAL
jgi:hypothetical protein